MERLIRISADYFTVGVFLTEDGKIRFPPLEKGAELTWQPFLEGLTLQHLKAVCDKHGWELEVLD